jgi:hypothetical protein
VGLRATPGWSSGDHCRRYPEKVSATIWAETFFDCLPSQVARVDVQTVWATLHEYTAKVWGEAEVPRGRTALTEEPGIGYTGGAWSYWSK